MYCQDAEHLKEYVECLDIQGNDQLMIFAGDKSEDCLDSVFEYLNSRKIQFFGGIFPKVIAGNNTFREGFVVQKLSPIYFSIIRPSMMKMLLNKEQLKDATAIVLVDGLSGIMTPLIETLYNKLGNSVNYIGGGAGFYNLIQKPCIFNNMGIHEDIGIVCVVKNEVEVAIAHGWKKLRGPFTVSKSSNNILNELDNVHAFKIYREIIEEEEKLTLSPEGFFTFSKDHPFGILQEDGSFLVRDAIGVTEDDFIVCIASIPQNSKVYILKGDVNSLLNSSLSISEALSLDIRGGNYQPLLFDCLSRAMFMEEKFGEELTNIQKNFSSQLEGVLSTCEITSNNSGEIVIHNKSIALGSYKK